MADVLGQEEIVPQTINTPVQTGSDNQPIALQHNTDQPSEDVLDTLSKKSLSDSSRRASQLQLPTDISRSTLQNRLGENANVEGYDIAETIAQKQSGLEQMAYFIPRAAAKATTEALKLPGFMVGAAEWASTGFDPKEYGNAFNNFWITDLDRINTDLQNNGLPVYQPKSVQNGDIFSKLASTSFWATEGADGVGFLVGMMAPGALLRWANLGERAVKTFSLAEKLAKPGIESGMAIEKGLASAKTAATIDDWSSAVVNTVYESATEGQGTFNDYLKQYPGDVQGAGEAAKKDFIANNAILIGPNLLNQKWLFNGFKRSEQAVNSVGKSAIANGLEKTIGSAGEITDLVKPTLFAKGLEVAKGLGEGVLSEGFFEEGFQQAASEGAKKHRNVLDPGTIIDEYIDQIIAPTKGNTEMWSSILLGGLMGGGMSMYHGISQSNKEENLVAEYHKLLDNNYLNYNKSLKDYAKIDKDNNPILNKDGSYDLDIAKLINGGATAIKNVKLREAAIEAYKTGDKEEYEHIQNILHFDYMLPWLKIEGGTELLKKHIQALASKEATKDKTDLGVETADNVKSIEKQLLAKVDKFQTIYDKVNDTHDINFGVKLSEGADKTDLSEFSNLIRSNKLSAKVQIDYVTDRINSLKDNLSRHGISSLDQKFGDKMISELENSYKDAQTKINIDKTEKIAIEKDLKDIKRFSNLYNTADKALAQTYDNKLLQKAFDQQVKVRLEAEKKKATAPAEKAKEEKAKTITDPGLQDLWNKNIKNSTLPTITPGKVDIVTHRGLVNIKYKDTDGKTKTVIAQIGDANNNGNLNVMTMKKDADGNWINDKIGYLNSTKEFAFAHQKVPFQATIEPRQSVDEVEQDTQVKAAVEIYQSYIEGYNKGIKQLSSDINDKKEHISELLTKLDDALKTHKKGLLTERGSERKIYTGTREEAGNVIRVYKTASEIKEDIAKAKEAIATLKDRIDSKREERTRFKEKIKELKASDRLPLDVLKELYEYSDKEEGFAKNMISFSTDALAEAEIQVSKTMSFVKGYNTQLAKILGIDISDKALGIEGMDDRSKLDVISNILLSKVSEMKEGLNVDEYHSYTFPEQESNLASQLEATRDKLLNLEKILDENKQSKDNYDKLYNEFSKERRGAASQFSKILKAYKKLIPQYFKEKDVYEDNLIVADKGINIEGLMTDAFVSAMPFEVDPKHTYEGFDSHLTITNNQESAASNKDVSRWFVFVNNYAYQGIHGSTLKYALKTYHFDQLEGESDFLRKNLMFYVGDGKTMSYADIISSKDVKKLSEVARKDIKAVVVNYKTGEVENFNSEGAPDSKGKNIIFSSLNAGEESSVEFSKRKFVNEFVKEKEAEGIDKTEAGKLALDEYDKVFAENLAKYTDFRDSLKNTSQILNITGINTGKKITDNEKEVDVLDGIKDPLYQAYFVVSAPSIDEETDEPDVYIDRNSGNEHNLISGFLYVYNQGKPEVVKPKTLKETGDTNGIMNLFKYIAKDGEKSGEVLAYLRKILHMTSDNPDFRLFITHDTDKKGKKIEDKYKTIVFGEHGELDLSDLAKGEKTADFKEFLDNKFWNVSNKLIKDNKSPFTEYRVNNKMEVSDHEWSVKDGGYKAFMFKVKDGNKSKGTIKVNEMPKGEHAEKLLAENPQYANQSLRTSVRGEEKVQTNKTTKTTQSTSNGKIYSVAITFPSGKKQKLKFAYYEDSNDFELIHPDIKESEQFKTDGLVKKIIEEKAFDWADNKSLHKVKGESSTVTVKFDHDIKSEDVKDETITEIRKEKLVKVGENLEVNFENNAPTKQVVIGNWEKLPQKVKGLFEKNAIKFIDPSILEGTAQYSQEVERLAKEEYAKSYNGDNSSFERTVRERKTNYEFEKKSTIDWFKQKFPKIPIEVVNGIIEGRAWGKLVHGSKVLISNVAEEGTTYHEGFHVWNILFNDENSRNDLYVEVKKRLGLQEHEMSDKDAEEFLAEEFRDFMMQGSAYKFNKGQELQKTFFQKIIDTIKHLLGLDIRTASKNEIEKAFQTISENTFIDRVNNSTESFNSKIKDVGPVEKLAYIKDMNYNFFNMLIEDVNKGGDLIFKLDQTPGDLYDRLNAHYEVKKVNDKVFLFDDVINHWDEFVREHKLFLTQYKIDLRTREDKLRTAESNEMDEDEKAPKSDDYSESMSKPIGDKIQSPVRLLIGSLVELDLAKGKEITDKETGKKRMAYPAKLSEYLTYSNVEYNRIVNLLSNELTQIPTPESMMNKLQYLTQAHPELLKLYKQLGGEQQANTMSETQMKLHMQFYSSFATNKNIPTVVSFKNNGNMTYANAVDEASKEVVKKTWIENAQKKAEDGTSRYVKKADGDYLLNKVTLLNDLEKAPSKGNSDQILKGLGMDMKMPFNLVNKNGFVHDYIQRLKAEVKKAIDDKRELSVNDLYDRDIVQNQSEMDAIATLASKNTENDVDLMYYNQDGNQEWSITRNSHITEVANRFNEYISNDANEIPESLNNVAPYNGKTGSLFSLHSIWWASRQKIKVGIMKGLVTQDGGSNELDKANFADYKVATFDSILRNVVPLRRAADRGPEYTFDVEGSNYNMGEDTLVSKMMDYLYDEVITSFGLLTEKNDTKFGSDLFNYSKNAKDLRMFGFLFDGQFNKGNHIESLEDFLVDSDTKKMDFKKLKVLTEQYIEINGPSIKSVMRNFIAESMKNNRESLLESSMIIRDAKSGRYEVPGINPETIGKGYLELRIDHRDMISNEDLNKMLRIHFANYFVGINEQMKFGLGDIASYKSMLDSGKRTTSSASTRVQTANDTKSLELVNRFYPKVNGAQHTDIINQVILAPIKMDASKELVAFDKHYKNMDIADGQMEGTLDFVRGIHARNGSWTNEQERSFHFEQQNLVLELYNEQIAFDKEHKAKSYKSEGSSELNSIWKGVSEEMFTREDGVFYNHTKGIVPTSPMFEGEVIDEYDIKKMGQIPALKPLGAGFLKGNNVSAQNITKCSVAPIIPSMLNKTELKFLLSMMQNDMDKFGDPTTQKGDYILNNNVIEDGYLIDESTKPTQLSYDDYGLQSEIQTEEHGRVTDSTQKIATIYNNIYDNGTLREEFKDLAGNVSERNELINEVNERNMNKVIKELALTYNKDTSRYKLTKENTEQFKDLLKEMFVQRLMPDNIIDGLDYVLDSEEKVLDLFTDSNKVEQVLTAFIKNNVIKRKVNGEMLVQESSYLYDKTLKFYERGLDGAPTSRAEVIRPIPEEWNEWVGKIGGIKALNMMVEQGKIDSRLINFLANRIPTADLNTIEAFTTKKFIPTHAGARIILPAAIVAKTSSDYDVDKLTCYLPNFEMTDNGPVYVEYKKGENESNEAIENRLNELHSEALLHNARYDHLMTPHASDRIKALAEKYYRGKGVLDKIDDANREKYYMSTQWWYNNRQAKANWGGIQGLGIAAASNVVNSQLQQFPVKIIDFAVSQGLLFFKGQELDTTKHNEQIRMNDPVYGERYTSGHLKDFDGNLTSDNYGQTMVTAVDVAKDPFGSKVNMTPATLGIWSFLNNFGKDAGVGMEQIAAMMTHPIVIEYLNKMDIQKSMFANHNQYKNRKEIGVYNSWFKDNIGWEGSIVDDLIAKYKPAVSSNLPTKYAETIASTMKEYMRNKKQNTPELLKKIERYKKSYTYLTADQIRKNETGNIAVQILDNFLTYKALAFQGQKLNSVLRPYASNRFSKSLNGIQMNVDNLDNIFEGGFFDPMDIEKHINDNFLKTSSQAYDTTLDLFSWTTLTRKYPQLHDLFKKYMVDKYINKKKEDSEKVLRDAKNQFLSFIYSFANTNTKEAQDKYNSMLIGDNSIPMQLRNIKDKISNKALESLRSVVGEYSSELGRIRENAYVTAFNRKIGVSEQNMLTATLEELFASKDKDVVKFANDFLDYSMYQNGIGNSHLTYMNIIPNSVFVNRLDGVMSSMDFTKDWEKPFMSFADQFVRNNYANKDIVERSSITYSEDDLSNGELVTTKFKNREVNILSRDARFDYITVRYYKTNSQERRTNARQKLKNPIEYLLYKKTGVDTKKGKVQFTLIEKLGDGVRFKEYYPTVNGIGVQSILKANRYDGVIEAKEGPVVVKKNETTSINRKFTPENVTSLKSNQVFVFGSNEGSSKGGPQTHGRGAALLARQKFGAKQGQSEGIQGKSYAIVTKKYWDKEKSSSLKEIQGGIEKFLVYAYRNKDKEFLVTKLGSSLAGYSVSQIKGLFNNLNNIMPIPENVILPKEYEVRDNVQNKSSNEVPDYVKDLKKMFQLDENIDNTPNEELDHSMNNFLSAIGVTTKIVDSIKDRTGMKIPAIAMADLSRWTLDVMEGKSNITTLPEEAAHFYVAMLDENSGLYKSMYNNIVNYPIYAKTIELYKEKYNNDEKMLREEAIGKLIADRIVNGVADESLSIRQKEQVNNWWTKLWSTIKDLFRKTNEDPYTKSAYDILTTNVEHLRVLQIVEDKTEIQQDNNSFYRGQISKPIIDKNGNLILRGTKDSLYTRAKLKDFGVSMTNDLKTAIDYGNGQLEVSINLASESYDAEEELNRLSENGYWLIQISKDVKNEIVKEAGEVKILGDIIVPKGGYKLEHITEDSNMYQLQNPQEQWTDLPFTAKGIYKYDYQRTVDAGEKAYSGYVNQFGSDNVTFIPITDGTYKSKIAIKKPLGSGDISEDIISKEDSAIENMKELAKAPVRLNAEQMSINFDTYFPGETWLEQSEKEAIMRTIENGENNIACNY